MAHGFRRSLPPWRGTDGGAGCPSRGVPSCGPLAPDDVAGLRDTTGMLVTRQDVTPMALAHQGLILDSQTTAVERAMRDAVRAMDL